MAIINTFEKCLDSPYLLKDPTAPARTAALIAQADQRLACAIKIHEAGHGDPVDAIYLAYEAMFCCVRALVHARGYRELGLHCLMLACESLYVRTGQLDIALLHRFQRAQRLKLTPAEAVDAAAAFLSRTRELLG